MDGYQYDGTFSTTSACVKKGDYLESKEAVMDFFCHPARRASLLYIEPVEDD